MKKIVIASKNPVKIDATLSGFQNMFPNEQFEIEGVSVPSGVSDQPKSFLRSFPIMTMSYHKKTKNFLANGLARKL